MPMETMLGDIWKPQMNGNHLGISLELENFYFLVLDHLKRKSILTLMWEEYLFKKIV